MPNQFLSPEGDLENYFVTEYQLIDQYIGDELWTWGQGSYGRLGNNTATNKSTPVTTSAGGTNWKQVSSGGAHCAAIKTDGTLWTWGRGTFGQLGTNNTSERSTPVTTFAGGTNWKQVSSGGYYTAAIKTDGTLWTWGRGAEGQLGTNGFGDKNSPVTTFAGGTNWKQVSAGNRHCAAIKTDGTLWTWGYSSNGQLGRTSASFIRLTPVTTFAGGTNWADTPTAEPEDLYTISAGIFNSVAIKTDGTLWTWGTGDNAQLGTNDRTTRSTPVTTFAGGTNWKQVSSGQEQIAAIKTDGTLWIWGRGFNGQLGTNINYSNTDFIQTPVTTFAGGTNWKQVSAGYRFTKAIKTDGTLWTWGGAYNAPFQEGSGTNWKQVSSGRYYTAAIKTDGTLWTWGDGTDGQLGTNDTTTRNTPVTTFAGGTNWKQVSSGFYHCAAIKTDGTLWTWGQGSYGKLGTNDTTNKSTPVTTFAGGTNWKQVSGGGNQTAAIKTDGTLWTWGRNNNGQLGTNDTTQRLTPSTTFAGGTNWKQVSSGSAHCAALLDDGVNKQLFLFGNNSNSQLGFPITISIPDQVEGNHTNWKQVSSGGIHCAAIKTDGTLWTWGSGSDGRLGTGDSTTRSTPVITFVGGTNWKQVSSGGYQNAAIKTDGTLWTWGRGSEGQLGRTSANANRLTPVTTFAGGTNWADTPTAEPEDLYTISAGIENYCSAIKTDGTLWTWGNGVSGQLGTNDTTTRITPVTTSAGGTTWKQVSAGTRHCAAIKTDGTLWTWGSGGQGQLGTNDTTQRLTPSTTFSGGTNWKQVSSGGYHCAAIKTDGTLWTWGLGTSGQLGTNDTTNKSTPVTTSAGGTNWKQVSSGNAHCAAIKTDGTLWTWGSGFNGQLGRSNGSVNRLTPVTTFAGGTNWADTPTAEPEDLYTISAGNAHCAAIKTDGTLWTWGGGSSGQLGNNTATSRNTPVTTFVGGTNWKQVSSGGYHCAAIKTDGTLWTWGRGDSGQLGNNTAISKSTPVTTFAGGTNWKQVSTGGNQTAAIKTDGTLWTWGYNGYAGRLGTNDNTTRNTPVTTFAGGTNWKQVSSGDRHCTAIKTDGTLWTWGSGFNAQLGVNQYTYIITPVTTFAGGNNWKQVSSGSACTAAIKTDGTLWTWGSGFNGELGVNQQTSKLTPVTTFAGETNWKQVSVGKGHCAAIKTDGTLWTWGGGISGRLGTNDTTNRFTPVTTFAGGTNWKQVSAASANGYSTVALLDDGVNKQLFLFGSNDSGKLGFPPPNISPDQVEGNSTNWKQVSSSSQNCAAIKTDGTLWTWGSGDQGRLGTNDTTQRLTPSTTFAGGTNWKQVSSGGYHCAAIKTDGTLWTWGTGFNGQLGDNTAISKSTPVTTFAGGTNWKQVSSGNSHTVALLDDGVDKQLFLFGSNTLGQLGSPAADISPDQVEGNSTNWKQVSSGSRHCAAIKTDGTLWTWGQGYGGKLGTNDTTNKSTPVTTFAGGTNWKQVSAGNAQCAAVTAGISPEYPLS